MPQRSRPAVLALLLAAAGTAGAAGQPPREHIVVIEGMAFSPATLHVKRGDRVVWVNRDLVPHTATDKEHAFDSRNIAAGAQWRYTASRHGTFAYDCAYHPTMTGTLVVE